jgi:hypothetical protein
MEALRLMRLILAALFLLLTAAVATRVVGAQESAVRFEIAEAGDSTFTFQIGRHPWVQRGIHGIAVDPRRRDVLVARFRVLDVKNGVATALITGQTTNVTSDLVALLDEPRKRWFQQPAFWVGTLLGVIIGGVAGASI